MFFPQECPCFMIHQIYHDASVVLCNSVQHRAITKQWKMFFPLAKSWRRKTLHVSLSLPTSLLCSYTHIYPTSNDTRNNYLIICCIFLIRCWKHASLSPILIKVCNLQEIQLSSNREESQRKELKYSMSQDSQFFSCPCRWFSATAWNALVCQKK